MYLNSIELNDFKCYQGTHKFTFDKINLVSGTNGVGKSTISVHAILFILYGYSENSLDSLKCKFVLNPKTYACMTLTYLGNDYEIKRSIPTHISIKVNGIESTLATNTLKQEELKKLFKDVEFFKRFRLLDLKDSINILEQGNSALRKTLVDLDDSIDIGTVRTNLTAKQNERNRLNKDTNVLYTHAPLQSRLTALMFGLKDINAMLQTYEAQLIGDERLLNTFNNTKSNIDTLKRIETNTNHTASTTCHCPTCKQLLPNTTQKKIVGDSAKLIKEYDDKLSILVSDISNQIDLITQLKATKCKLINKKMITQKYIQRLEARLQQKEFIYTTKDVEVMKSSVRELDGFTTFFITEKLQRIEPLINSLLGKLGFTVTFSVDAKNNFDIKLLNNNNGTEFVYKELSNGQRLFVTVAFQLALLMEKNESGLVVADEGFSSLSGTNLDLMFDLFKNSPFQLVSIVHRFQTNDASIKNIQL